MRAAVLHARGDLRAERIDTPTAGAGEILLRVAYCGICGSDMPRILHDGAHFYPIVLGHEFSGIIAAVGEGVDPGLVGRKAACAPLLPNFEHPQSVLGNYALGSGYSFIGSRRQGGFAEYVNLPARNAILLPDTLDLLPAAFIEPLTVGLHALQIMDFRPGRRVALIGAGTIGLLLLQAIQRLGAGRISVFDIDDAKLETAKTLGADHVANSADPDAVTDAGYEIVFETAGAPAAERMALRLAGAKARVMFVGTPHVPLTLQPAEFELINRKELTLQGSWMNYSAPFPGWEWETGVDFLAAGDIKTEALVDRVIALHKAADVPQILSKPAEMKGRIIFDCTR